MRHGLTGRQLSRNATHRSAMLRNMAASLLRHETIKTTVPKAKELRRFVEPLITLGKKDSEANRRLAFSRLRDAEVVTKLFDELGPRFAARPGGYTRILHMANRAGDNADMALMALVDRAAPAAEAPAADEGEKKPKARKKKARRRGSRRGSRCGRRAGQEAARAAQEEGRRRPDPSDSCRGPVDSAGTLMPRERRSRTRVRLFFLWPSNTVHRIHQTPRSGQHMSIVTEFKEFAMKGNVLDMAVGVVIGAAFGKIVSSLVGDVSRR